MHIIDTHNHLYFPKFAGQLDQVLTEARAAGVTHQMLIGIDELSCQAALSLAKDYDDFKVVLGLHPCDVDQLGLYDEIYHQYVGIEPTLRSAHLSLEAYFAWLDELALRYNELVVGFGETGFDQFHRQSAELFKLQTESFERHVALGRKHAKTLVIHSRGARTETLDFISQRQAEFSQLKFVWHCFTEDLAAAQAVVKLGGYIGVGGVSTYPKSSDVREIIRALPLENLLTETDAPFLTPHQARKGGVKLNGPQFLPEVIATIADLKKMTVEDCAAELYKNAQRAFGL